MPLYEFKGINAAGKQITGTQDAPNKQALRDALLRTGVYLSSAVEKGKAKTETSLKDVKIGGSKIKAGDILNFTSQFATLQNAGIPLVECLNALSDQSESEALKTCLLDIKQQVAEGSSLAAAMSKHPKAFDGLYINMIRAGESSGSLDIVLTRLTDFLESQQRIKSKVSGAMAYPAVMAGVGVLLMCVLFIFVIPRITVLFDQQRKELPLITEILLALTDFFSNYWWTLILAGIAIFVAFKYWTSNPKGHYQWDSIKLKIPIFGQIIRLQAVSRFSKTLGTLLNSGVPLLKAMGIVKSILGNDVLCKVVEDACNNIKEGESVAAPLKRSGEFPPMMTHMITVGEKSGRLEVMLDKVADTYEQQISTKVETLTSLLEPLMIVVLGGSMAFIIFAILLPIMQLSDGFG